MLRALRSTIVAVSCHTYEWVVGHLWRSLPPHIQGSSSIYSATCAAGSLPNNSWLIVSHISVISQCPVYECVISRIGMASRKCSATCAAGFLLQNIFDTHTHTHKDTPASKSELVPAVTRVGIGRCIFLHFRADFVYRVMISTVSSPPSSSSWFKPNFPKSALRGVTHCYGVATISRRIKTIGLICRISSLL